MATLDKTGSGSAYAYPHQSPKLFVLENTIDMTGVTTAIGDVVQALKIPSGTFVFAIKTKINTASAAGNAVDCGDGSDADGWDIDINFTATGTHISNGTETGGDAYAVANGKLYTADDTIDYTVNADIAGAKFEVKAICIDTN